jgi:hypothetical protein
MGKGFIIRKMPESLLAIAFTLIIFPIGVGNSFIFPAYGHDFVPNESASFLSFVNQLQTESNLVQSNLANGNLTLAREHATRAVELLDSKDPINNVTWKDEIAEETEESQMSLLQRYLILRT